MSILIILNSKLVLWGDNAIARYFVRSGNGQLQHNDKLEESEIDQWLDLTNVVSNDIDYCLSILENALKMRTYLVGNDISLADIGMWAAFIKNSVEIDGTSYPNVSRWYNLVGSNKVVKQSVGRLSSDLRRSQTTKPKKLVPVVENKNNNTKKNLDLGGMPPLPGAEMGKVVTRFPPEASGYLHIGHVKAVTLNSEYAKLYKGKLLVRFDDTNPNKEKDEFENAIMEYL